MTLFIYFKTTRDASVSIRENIISYLNDRSASRIVHRDLLILSPFLEDPMQHWICNNFWDAIIAPIDRSNLL